MDSHRSRVRAGATLLAVVALASQRMPGQRGRGSQNLPAAIELAPNNAMTNPYRMLEQWPHLGDIKPGAAIGIVPDGKGGVWLQHRPVPAIVHIDPSGNITKRFDVTFSSAHGMCRDRDGNFWAIDSGPFGDAPDAGVRGNQVFKFDPDGKLLLTLGQAGVSSPRLVRPPPMATSSSPMAAALDRAAGWRSARVVQQGWQIH
jgi:streptogramin lyase